MDAGDATDRQIRRAAAQHRDDSRKPCWSNRRIFLLFGRSNVHAAAANIINQIDWRRFGFVYRFYRQSDDRFGSKQAPCILNRHVLLAQMNAVGAGGDRHVDPIIDHEWDTERCQRLFDRSRNVDHSPRHRNGDEGGVHRRFVRNWEECCAAAGALPRQIGKAMPAGLLRIDDRVKTKIEPHHDALTRARSAARSSPCRASIIANAKLPGPWARCAASSPATPNAAVAASVASQVSGSTASAAQTKAALAHPMAVTRPISGSPLAIAMPRRPSLTMSTSPVRATTVS